MSEAERWSVRESRVRGIERKMERKKSRVWKMSLNYPSYSLIGVMRNILPGSTKQS